MQKLCRVQKSCQPKKEQVRRLPCPHPAGLPDPSAYKIMILDRLIIRQEKKEGDRNFFRPPLKALYRGRWASGMWRVHISPNSETWLSDTI